MKFLSYFSIFIFHVMLFEMLLPLLIFFIIFYIDIFFFINLVLQCDIITIYIDTNKRNILYSTIYINENT